MASRLGLLEVWGIWWGGLSDLGDLGFYKRLMGLQDPQEGFKVYRGTVTILYTCTQDLGSFLVGEGFGVV